MKVLKIIDEKYYPEGDEALQIKRNGKIKLKDLAKELGISYAHLWRKLTRYNYPNNAFSRMEVERIQVLTGLKFNLH